MAFLKRVGDQLTELELRILKEARKQIDCNHPWVVPSTISSYMLANVEQFEKERRSGAVYKAIKRLTKNGYLEILYGSSTTFKLLRLTDKGREITGGSVYIYV